MFRPRREMRVHYPRVSQFYLTEVFSNGEPFSCFNVLGVPPHCPVKSDAPGLIILRTFVGSLTFLRIYSCKMTVMLTQEGPMHQSPCKLGFTAVCVHLASFWLGMSRG